LRKKFKRVFQKKNNFFEILLKTIFEKNFASKFWEKNLKKQRLKEVFSGKNSFISNYICACRLNQRLSNDVPNVFIRQKLTTVQTLELS